MKTEIQDCIKVLANKAKNNDDHLAAVTYAEAVLKLSNALAALHYIDAPRFGETGIPTVTQES